MLPPSKRRFGKPQLILILAGLVVAVVVGLVIRGHFASRGPTQESVVLVAVKRGNLPIRITEMGEMTSKNPIKLAPETKSAYKIASIVDAGTMVKAGDVLVELDKSDLVQKISDQEIKVESEKAALTTANENYSIEQLNSETDRNDAELTLEFNTLALERYLGKPVTDDALNVLSAATGPELEVLDFFLLSAEPSASDPPTGLLSFFGVTGEAFQKAREAELAVVKAQKELQWAKDDLQTTQELVSKGFEASQELEKAQFDVQQKDNALATASLARNLLKRYSMLQEVQSKVNDVLKARNNREVTKSRATSKLAQRQVSVTEAQMRVEAAGRQLHDYRDELKKMTICAPSPGLVLIGEQRSGHYRSSDDDIKVGGTAYPGRTLITLPDFSIMEASIQVHEVDINRVKVGQKADIVLDAYPDVTFHGQVRDVAKLAEQQSWWMGGEVKVFTVKITIDGADERLRPGMTAKVDILVGEAEGVLYVPVDSVREQGGAKVCLISLAGQLVPRELVTGVSNDKFVEIKEGLSEGDTIALAPKLSEAGAIPDLSGKGEEKRRDLTAATESATQGSGSRGSREGSDRAGP